MPPRPQPRSGHMNARRARLLAAIVLSGFGLALLSGCGDDEAPDSPTPPTDGQLVSYSRSGGIAGVDQVLTIDADGTGTYEVGQPEPERRSIELSAAELEELRGLLEAAALDAVEPEQTGCADCFVYTIDYAGTETTLDDVTLLDAPGSVQEVIAHLDRVAAEA